MLLSESKKFLFVHIQKTAGTSLTRHLKQHIPDITPVLRPHDPISSAEKQLQMSLGQYFKAAFVRNPFDRLVSWYSMIEHHGVLLTEKEKRETPCYNKIWQHVLSESNNFEEFILNCQHAEDRSGWKPFLYNQIDYLKDTSGQINADFIGRFENITQDIAKLCRVLGITETKIPHTNKSTHANYRAYYSPHTRAIIEQRFALDLEYFGYQF